jgi:hypothetical protein
VEVEALAAVVKATQRAHVLFQRDVPEGPAEGVLREGLDPGPVAGVDGVEHLADALAAPARGRSRVVGVVRGGRLGEGGRGEGEDRGDGGGEAGTATTGWDRVVLLPVRAFKRMDVAEALQD